MSVVTALFLLADSVAKFVKPAPVLQTCAQLGLPAGSITPIGVICLLCTLLYVIPRTAPLGAILLTGYLGGAVAIHLRAGSPLFRQMSFPVYVGIMVWLGVYLRDARVRALLRPQ